MKYKVFGQNTGLRVSELALGTGNFGTRWGHGSERDEARKIFNAYVAAGGNFIDTANNYQFGESEEIVGALIAPDRDHFVVATKYSFATSPQDGVTRTGNSRKNMILSVEQSLKRLKTDYIDLYWAHVPDGHTPIEEILSAFDTLVRSGKILYAGLSNFPAWRVSRAATLAELRGLPALAGIQIEYSLAERSPERELLPMAEALGLGATLWSPLGGGFLTGKYRESNEGRLTGLGGILIHTEKSQRETQILNSVLAVAAALDTTPTQVAIAWLLHRAHHSPTSLIPILGPRTLGQLEGTLGALHLSLAPEHISQLENASAIPLGVPHQMISNSAAGVAGGNAEHLEQPKIPVI